MVRTQVPSWADVLYLCSKKKKEKEKKEKKKEGTLSLSGQGWSKAFFEVYTLPIA